MLARKALAGTAAAPKVYVEDVFSTYLYTGTGSSQTITNNIDISGEGGLVWIKGRTEATNHLLADTVNGTTKHLQTSTTGAAFDGSSSYITGFSSTGFSVGSSIGIGTNGQTYASWTFRKAKKFFDVVTYTGNGSNRTISHNLGSIPGCIIVKRTDTTAAWAVYHRSLANTEYLVLNTTAAKATGATYWNSTTPTSTVFSLGTSTDVNANNGTYVAYLFAHDAGGFGDAGSDNVISCGSFTTDGSGNATVTLGYEPQWVLVKVSSTTGSWRLLDNMRGIPTGGNDAVLFANLSAAEDSGSDVADLNATGFSVKGLNASADFVYIAIRRGPMKTPTSGTSVFSPNAYTGTGAGQTYTTNFPVDMTITSRRSPSGANHEVYDRLRPWYAYLFTDTTAAEGTAFGTTNQWLVDRMDSVKWNTGDGFTNVASDTYCTWNFRRAPGFFDVVCYTGNGSYGRTISHNLGVAPELLIVKQRSLARGWAVYAAPLGATEVLQLHLSDAKSTSDWFANTTPTSSVFSVGSNQIVNENSQTFVAYLFASVTGVSKVGSYTGNGSSVTVTTGFQPRFILVKRTDSTGNWIVSDSARGLVAGNDPYLLLNSTAAEDTDEDWVDVSSTGFTVNQVTASNANVNTGTYIYLAIA